MKKILTILSIVIGLVQISYAQFGQNKVNYANGDWYFIQSKHFDIYFAKGSEKIAEFAASAAEDAADKIQKSINYQLGSRIALIVYASHNDFQETNTTDEYLSSGTGGFTEPFRNRVVFPFEGSYKKYQHVIAHELVHAVMRDMYYGGTIQNMISKGITLQLPLWFWEGSAEYLSQEWETNTDMFIRNAITNDILPDINRLDGYLAYRGGQSVFRFISETYGKQKISELMSKVQSAGSLEPALKAAIGIDLEELNDRWKKSVKKEFWPDVKDFKDPDEFAKRLTNNKKDIGFYNISPAISPQGDKIAFISDRDIYFDVYLMDAQDGKVIKKLVSSGKEVDFEELNVLQPSLSWAPDNKRVALSSKNAGADVITVINTETDEVSELPFKMLGIESVDWSRDGNKIAFAAHNAVQSDIYYYDFTTQTVTNVTNDVFSDSNPVWTPDSKSIIFSSDRDSLLTQVIPTHEFEMQNHNYKQLDLFSIELDSKKVNRITDWNLSDEKYASVTPDGNEVIFVSDKNGINNIYKKSIKNSDAKSKAIPLTNSISDLGYTSLTANGKKLVFSALYNSGYNIFMLNNLPDLKLDTDTLRNTVYMSRLLNPKPILQNKEESKIVAEKDSASVQKFVLLDSTKTNKQPRIVVGTHTGDKTVAQDSSASDYSKYVFANHNMEKDSLQGRKSLELFKEKLDTNGNYLVNKYKVDFSPDLVYANAGYSTMYGLLGTTILSFSDVLGNHRLIGQTSLQIDIKNSDYGLAYFYLKERMDFGIQIFHTARFLYRSSLYGDELYRYRNFGIITNASYPFSKFDRFDFGFSVMRVSSENLDNINVPTDGNTFLIPSAGYVHDNTMWGYYSPIEGSRYSFNTFGDPGLIKSRQSFISFIGDYRKYFRFWYDNSFVIRLSGGVSGGANAQRFFVGGVENWINRSFATNQIPVQSASDFAFLTPAMPLRGFDFAERIGTKYALLNLELRMPIIRYLLTGGLPLLFQNILGVVFLDAGSAWDDTNKLQFIGTNEFGSTVTKDLLVGTGVGFRFNFIFLWKLDIAWKYNLEKFTSPRYYLSIGMDF